MLLRDEWCDLARKLDWSFCYAKERQLYPEVPSSTPRLSAEDWGDGDQPLRSTFAEYLATQRNKEVVFQAVVAAVGRVADGSRLDIAALPLAEFAAVVRNLRGEAPFGRVG